LVREPIARLQSMYLHQIGNGRERRPILDALREDDEYVSASSYAAQLDCYLAHFPRERVYVLTTESMAHDRAGALSDLYAFLGVDPLFVPADVDEVRGRTEDKRVRSDFGRRLREAPGLRSLARALPGAMRSRALRITTRPIDPARA